MKQRMSQRKFPQGKRKSELRLENLIGDIKEILISNVQKLVQSSELPLEKKRVLTPLVKQLSSLFKPKPFLQKESLSGKYKQLVELKEAKSFIDIIFGT